MSTDIRFRSEVAEDIANAIHWYEGRRDGLGQDFLDELTASLSRLKENPEMYSVGYRKVRSARLHRFPYVVHYIFEQGTVVVLAVIHGSRDPAIWKRRL